MNSYSQCGEDRWIVQNLAVPRVGTFCEVGAYDGELNSNTRLFEQAGWTGICVEADPYLAARCWQNRKALTWCCAAGLKTHGVFYVNEFDRGLSGFEADGKPMTVLTKPLDWLLAASGLQKLDLLSVDVEGTELEVWESIGEVRPTIVVMEYRTGCLPPKDKEIVERMMRDGYREVHRPAYNLIFEHHERK